MRITRRQFAKLALATTLVSPFALNASIATAKDKYVIGFSQELGLPPFEVAVDRSEERII